MQSRRFHAHVENEEKAPVGSLVGPSEGKARMRKKERKERQPFLLTLCCRRSVIWSAVSTGQRSFVSWKNGVFPWALQLDRRNGVVRSDFEAHQSWFPTWQSEHLALRTVCHIFFFVYVFLFPPLSGLSSAKSSLGSTWTTLYLRKLIFLRVFFLSPLLCTWLDRGNKNEWRYLLQHPAAPVGVADQGVLRVRLWNGVFYFNCDRNL